MKIFRGIQRKNCAYLRIVSSHGKKQGRSGNGRSLFFLPAVFTTAFTVLLQGYAAAAVENEFKKSGVSEIVKDLSSQDVEVMYGDTLVLNDENLGPFYFTHDDVHYRIDESGIVQRFDVEIREEKNGKKICGAFDGSVQCYQLFLGGSESQKSDAVLVASIGSGKYTVLKGQLLDYRDTPFYDYEDAKIRHFYETLLGSGESKAVVDDVKSYFEIYHSARWCADERYIEESTMGPLEAEIKSKVAALVAPASKDLIWDAAKTQNGITANLAVLGSDEQKYQLCEMVRGLLSRTRSSGDNPF